MTETIVDGYQVLQSEDGRVWVTSPGGETVGRFDPRLGIDVHRTLEEQQEGGSHCLDCRSEAVEIEEFIASMWKHYVLNLSFLSNAKS